MTEGMRLTEAQVSELRSLGAVLDAKDMEIADRLKRRGFTGDEFVAAYRESKALGATYPELSRFGRETVESVAVARKLNLNENDKYSLVWYRHDENLSLTDAYNRKVVGGPLLRKAGWIIGGVGVALLLTGAVLVGDRKCNYYYQNNPAYACLDDSRSNTGWTGVGLLVGGGGMVATAIPMVILGHIRTGRWVAPGALDTSPADSLGSMRASARGLGTSTIQWAVAPSVGSNHAGLGLLAVF